MSHRKHRTTAITRETPHQLADGDAHAVSAEVTEPQNTPTVSHHQSAHVLLWPVLQHLQHTAFLLQADVQALWVLCLLVRESDEREEGRRQKEGGRRKKEEGRRGTERKEEGREMCERDRKQTHQAATENVAKLLAHLSHSWCVHQRHHFLHSGQQHLVEQLLVAHAQVIKKQEALQIVLEQRHDVERALDFRLRLGRVRRERQLGALKDAHKYTTFSSCITAGNRPSRRRLRLSRSVKDKPLLYLGLRIRSEPFDDE